MRLLKPIELSCVSPAVGESASRDVLSLLNEHQDLASNVRKGFAAPRFGVFGWLFWF
jgi:hypothetical protein